MRGRSAYSYIDNQQSELSEPQSQGQSDIRVDYTSRADVVFSAQERTSALNVVPLVSNAFTIGTENGGIRPVTKSPIPGKSYLVATGRKTLLTPRSVPLPTHLWLHSLRY